MNPNPTTRSFTPRLLTSLGGLLLALSAPAHLRAADATPPAPAPASPAHVAAPAGLIKNSGFELAGDENPNWPAHWSQPNSGSFSWEREEQFRFVRLNVAEPGELVMLYHIIQIPAGVKALEISLRARVIGLKCGPQPWFDARVMADFKNPTGLKLKGAKAIAFRKDTDGWVERKVRFAVPESGVALELMPCLFRAYSGTFDIDELQVTPIDLAELDPKPAPKPAPAPAAPAPAPAPAS